MGINGNNILIQNNYLWLIWNCPFENLFRPLIKWSTCKSYISMELSNLFYGIILGFLYYR